LDRGQVAVIRSAPDGRLSDVSVLDRGWAPIERVGAAIAKPGAWSRFIPGVEESAELAHADATLRYKTSFHVPLVTWTATWDMIKSPTAYDSAAIEGDLAGARAR